MPISPEQNLRLFRILQGKPTGPLSGLLAPG
jgi:hypothetical protein